MSGSSLHHCDNGLSWMRQECKVRTTWGQDTSRRCYAGFGNGMVPHLPQDPLSEQGLLLITKQRRLNSEECNPHPHSNTHIPEVRTTQNSIRPRDSPDFGEHISAHTSTAFFKIRDATAQEETIPDFFFLFKLNKFLNLSNRNAKLWKTIISENSSY